MALDRTWYNSLVDDDGSNTVGSIWDKAAVDHVYDDVDAALLTLDPNDAVPAARTDTGTVNNWALTLTKNTLTRWTGAADLTVTGLADGVAGRRWTFRNVGSKVAYLAHASTGSLTANRFTNAATSAPTPVAPGGAATYQHDGTAWVLIAHHQGAYITPTYSAGHFTGWTVEAGDVSTSKFFLSGRSLTYLFVLNTVTIAGSPANVTITNGQYGGFTVTGGAVNTIGYANDGAVKPAYIQGSNGATGLVLAPTSGAWGNPTNAGYFQGSITFEVI